MTATFKAWCLGGLVAINGLLAVSLALTWLSIYEQFSHPIDFSLPVQRAQMHATLILYVAAVSVPLAFAIHRRTERDLPPSARVASLLISSVAAFVAIAFYVWRYLR